VARAKRTDRSTARRQYRAYVQAQAEAEAAAIAEEEAENEPDAAAEKPEAGRWRFPGARNATSSADAARPSSPAAGAHDGRSRPGPASGAAGSQPVGFLAALKTAYRPVHYRDDLHYLPQLATGSPAIWVSLMLVIVGGAIVAVDADVNDFWFQVGMMMIAPWPIIPSMLGGIVAPRAAWLAGAVTGLAAGLVLCVVVAVSSNVADLSNVDTGVIVGQLIYYIIAAICFGAVMASLAAWYKRFLQLLMGTNQRRSSGSRARAKKPARRPQTARR
jgi:hypothetical protein